MPLIVVARPSPRIVRPSMPERSRFMMPLIASTWPVFSATSTIGMNQNRLNDLVLKLGNEKVGAPNQLALEMPAVLTWQPAVAAAHAPPAIWSAPETR